MSLACPLFFIKFVQLRVNRIVYNKSWMKVYIFNIIYLNIFLRGILEMKKNTVLFALSFMILGGTIEAVTGVKIAAELKP